MTGGGVEEQKKSSSKEKLNEKQVYAGQLTLKSIHAMA